MHILRYDLIRQQRRGTYTTNDYSHEKWLSEFYWVKWDVINFIMGNKADRGGRSVHEIVATLKDYGKTSYF